MKQLHKKQQKCSRKKYGIKCSKFLDILLPSSCLVVDKPSNENLQYKCVSLEKLDQSFYVEKIYADQKKTYKSIICIFKLAMY